MAPSSPTLAAALARRNARTAIFESIVQDYNNVLAASVQSARELRAANERAASLQLEVHDMKELVKRGEVDSSRAAEAAEIVDEYRSIQGELAQAYKDLLAAKSTIDKMTAEAEEQRAKSDALTVEAREAAEANAEFQRQVRCAKWVRGSPGNELGGPLSVEIRRPFLRIVGDVPRSLSRVLHREWHVTKWRARG